MELTFRGIYVDTSQFKNDSCVTVQVTAYKKGEREGRVVVEGCEASDQVLYRLPDFWNEAISRPLGKAESIKEVEDIMTGVVGEWLWGDLYDRPQLSVVDFGDTAFDDLDSVKIQILVKQETIFMETGRHGYVTDRYTRYWQPDTGKVTKSRSRRRSDSEVAKAGRRAASETEMMAIASKAASSAQYVDRNRWDGTESIVSVRVRKRVEKAAFKNCLTLEDVLIARDCDVIGPEAFANCTSLKTVVSQRRKSRRQLASGLFRGCTSLETATIDGMRFGSAKGSKLFDKCTSLRTIALAIYDRSEFRANALGSVPNLESVILMGNGTIAKDAFRGCPRLREVVVSPETKSDIGSLAELPKDCVIRCGEESELTAYAKERGIQVVIGDDDE